MVAINEEDFDKKRKILIERLVQVEALRNERFIDAMQIVKRHLFVWDGHENYAYLDSALPLGETGQTISPPHLCAYMLEALSPETGENVLEIGTGSGYMAALIAESIAPSSMGKEVWGKLTTIERDELLWEFAKKNLQRAGYSERVDCILGDGTLGFPPISDVELYDKILVTAMAFTPPTPLMRQLKKGGVMVIPVGEKHSQQLTMIIKGKSGEVETLPIQRCEFVPLLGKYGWR